jgi:hypothetical protein
VFEGVSRQPARGLPLVACTGPGHVFAWHDGHAVGLAEFLGDVATVAAMLPATGDAINLCDDRYAFLVAFCAVACRGQANLLPSSRADRPD